MAEGTEFVTVERTAVAEVVIKKSRFIGQVVPVRSVEMAETALAEVRAAHKGARHHCFAYRVGLGVPVERYADDGEPGGTAGRPILEVLRRKDLRNVLGVVTRYFGGTLLGANGLVRAYTEATAAAVAAATPLSCQPMCQWTVHCDYAAFGKLEYQLTQLGHTLEEKVYAQGVSFSFWVPAIASAQTQTTLLEGSNGLADIHIGEAVYVGVTEDGHFVHDVVEDPGE
ncbi:DUF1949 domain-containing protein [Alicyclobacillaceae bacterium I2511]|nr:DUF1949 domain-containing protein [Alicyclobacillaceae bacterium I2511]